MNVGLLGFGYWGMNLARTINKIEDINLVSIYDIDKNRVKEAQKYYKFNIVNSYKEFLSLDIDAVFIATPPETHYNLSKKALNANKHIFVEKPFTLNMEHAYRLIEFAEAKNLKYMVDHVFVFSEPVKFLKNTLEKFGEIVYINSRRINLGLFQYSTDVIWDLAVHDLSIIDYLVGLEIKKVSVFKKKYKNFPNEAYANINLELMNGISIGINVSWLSPVKVREMIIGGTKMTAVYDDTVKNKIRLYDAGVILEKDLNREELYSYMVQYKYGDVIIPDLSQNESLKNSVEHFKYCVEENKTPLTDKKSILNVIKTLEIISKV